MILSLKTYLKFIGYGKFCIIISSQDQNPKTKMGHFNKRPFNAFHPIQATLPFKQNLNLLKWLKMSKTPF
jgi:hypothetical protein